MTGRWATHLEPFSRLSLLARLLNLRPPHLLLELSFLHAAVVLEGKQDIKIGQGLKILVVPPLFRFQHERVRVAPSCEYIHL